MSDIESSASADIEAGSDDEQADQQHEEDQQEHHEEEEKLMTQEEGRQKVIELLKGDVTFPVGFEDSDIIAFIENIDCPQEFNEEAIESYHQECLTLIKEELVPTPETPEEDDEDVTNLTPDFIAERLSDLQGLEGQHLTFAFTSFGVQEAQIYDIKALSEFQALLFISLKKNIVSDASPLSGLPTLRELYLNENKIVSFSGITLPALEVLDLRENQMKTLGPLSLPKLKKLNLSQNQICFISPQAFAETTELEELNLSENKLKAFKPGTFRTTGKLSHLKLDQNAIGHIQDGIFDGLVGLKKLEMGENPVESIPGLSACSTLEELDMHQANLEQMDDLKPLIDLKCLKSVNLDGAPVEGVDTFKSDMILMLPWLETIDDESISFSDRQEAIALDEERKAEAERIRLEEEQAAKERAAAEEEEEAAAHEEDQHEEDEDGY